MTNEDLYWLRVEKLFTMYNNITDDLVYKAMWERKLKELLLKLSLFNSIKSSPLLFKFDINDILYIN